MTLDDDSIERAISQQHRRLDAVFEELLAMIREGAPPDTTRDAFVRLREALEAHLEHEERLYFPPLRALRPVDRKTLDQLIGAHGDFRARLEALALRFGARDVEDAEAAIAAFAEVFAAHEASEEQMLARIDAEVSARAASE